MGKKQQVLRIVSVLNLFRGIHEPETGPVTVAEQRKELTRALNWHQRQVTVCQQMLDRLNAEQPASDSVRETASLPAE